MTARTILITGAGSGIGRDTAFALAARGHRVIATTYSEAQADALRETCRSRGISYFYVRSDHPVEHVLLDTLRRTGVLR